MAEQKGTITLLEEREAQRGRKFWLIKLDTIDQGFFCWRSNLVEGLKVGDEVTINYREGEFPRVLNIIKEKQQQIKTEKIQDQPQVQQVLADVQNQGIRIRALNCAVALMGNIKGNGKTKLIQEGVVELARKFERYIREG